MGRGRTCAILVAKFGGKFRHDRDLRGAIEPFIAFVQAEREGERGENRGYLATSEIIILGRFFCVPRRATAINYRRLTLPHCFIARALARAYRGLHG